MARAGISAIAFVAFSLIFSAGALAHFSSDGDPRFYTILHITPDDPPFTGTVSDMWLSIYNATSGEPIVGLDVLHERVVHMFVVSRDTETFAHIHAEDRVNGTEYAGQGMFAFNYTFPREGVYAVVVDFTYGGTTVVKKFELYALNDASSSYPAAGSDPVIDFSNRRSVSGYEIELTVPERIEVGKEAEMSLHVEDADGPVRDLGQYLGSEAHVLFLRDDLKYNSHTHAYRPSHALHFGRMAQLYYGPDVPIRHTFQQPGTYSAFVQFERGGEVVTSKFWVKVEDSAYSATLLYGSYAAIIIFAVVLFRREIFGLVARGKGRGPSR